MHAGRGQLLHSGSNNGAPVGVQGCGASPIQLHAPPPPRFSLAAVMLAEPSMFESYLYGAQWMMKPFK